LLRAAKQMEETQMNFNLQYLDLQRRMQEENRCYLSVSDIAKSDYETVARSIKNIR
jgi:hypothetical protein